MSTKLDEIRQNLLLHNQEHLLDFYDELSDIEKETLLSQIENIDFNNIFTLYENSKIDEVISPKDITPLKHYEKNILTNEEILYYENIGNNIISSEEIAVVTLAGGQGSRLGYKGPKGTYELTIDKTQKSLFQILCEDIQKTNKKFNIALYWYIMTSEENNGQTQEYFKKHNFFNYPKDHIIFFTQGKLPIISKDKKLILSELHRIKEGSNGNGNVFSSLKKHNLISDMISKNIKWVSFGGIDNVLLKNIDPLLIGLTSDTNLSIASKSIFKNDPLERTAVFCKKYGKPSILDYDLIDLELSESKDENDLYLYREANMVSHLMSIDAIEKVSNLTLKYHKAFKKNAFINDEGMKQIPDKPNSFKFENFIFDAFEFFDDMILLRVNPEEEFAPIKDFTGIYNPDSALEKYLSYHNKKK